MQQPRKKLGTSLGIAPNLSVFAPAPVTQPSMGLETTISERADGTASDTPLDVDVEVATAPEFIAPEAAAPKTELHVVPALEVAAPPKQPKAPRKASPAMPAPIPALAKRVHGTFSEPYQRRTDGIQTRQTTLTLNIELDDRFETFFRKHRGLYKSRSAAWAAAMEFFLQHKS